MRITDTIHLSIETFKNRKSRTFLTALGVAIGIGAVLFLVSLGYGLQNLLLERITTAESFLTLDVASSDTNIIPLNQETLNKISQVPGVARVSPQAVFPGQISANNLTSESVVSFIDPDFFALNGALPTYGETFKESETSKVVVNTKVAELFSLTPEELVGRKIRFVVFQSIDSDGETDEVETVDMLQDFEIAGVIEESDAAIQIFANRKLPIKIEEFAFVKVQVNDDAVLEQAREQLLNMGFVVSAISDIVEQANKIFRAIQITLAVFGVVAVIVAAISLANTMTISLLERTQEIGVMRAIGASKSDIRNLFLIESTLIGLSGGVLGILIGWIGTVLVNFGLNLLATNLGGNAVDIFSTPLWFIIFVLAFSTSVGLITGFFPARRAAKLNPLTALRYK